MDDARLFLCARCRRQVLICSRCDRGQQYCGARSSGPARRESLRAAGRRYQHSRPGRHCHAECQRRYRRRCREDARAQKVTHHGWDDRIPGIAGILGLRRAFGRPRAGSPRSQEAAGPG